MISSLVALKFRVLSLLYRVLVHSTYATFMVYESGTIFSDLLPSLDFSVLKFFSLMNDRKWVFMVHFYSSVNSSSYFCQLSALVSQSEGSEPSSFSLDKANLVQALGGVPRTLRMM